MPKVRFFQFAGNFKHCLIPVTEQKAFHWKSKNVWPQRTGAPEFVVVVVVVVVGNQVNERQKWCTCSTFEVLLRNELPVCPGMVRLGHLRGS